MSPPAVLLLGRDLRSTDHPALLAAAEHSSVLALFVIDDALVRARTTGANRLGFLLESLEDLRTTLRSLGGELVVRRGDPASLALAAARSVRARTVVVSSDATPTYRRRRDALVAGAADLGAEVLECEGVAIVAPDALHPAGGDHYRVFTPYFRSWSGAPRRPVLAAPDSLTSPEGVEAGEIPSLEELAAGADPVGRRRFEPFELVAVSPARVRGGERAALERLEAFGASGDLTGYAELSDALGQDRTSRLGAYLHFGCVSARVVEAAALEGRRNGTEGSDAFVRQLCWRDFYLAVSAASPAVNLHDYRARPIEWRRDAQELAAWKEGRTGVDIVDAAMHQLTEEGFVHNRARLVASSYLTKTLRHHWREGAEHYLLWLTDGDIASNSMNWQWMAGTGNDTRPNRTLNPRRQADRFDADHTYRRRHGADAPAAQARLDLS